MRALPVVLVTALLSLPLFADDPVIIFEKDFFHTYLEKMVETKDDNLGFHSKRDQPRSPEDFLLKTTTKFVTDDVRLALSQGTVLPKDGREHEKAEVLDVFLRSRGRFPVLVGRSRVGKTSIMVMLAQDILGGKLPPSDIYRSQFENAEILETSASRISQMALSDEPTAQAAALELFFEAVRLTQKRYEQQSGKKKPLIILIDELHTLDPPQFAALKHVIENESASFRVAGAAPSEQLDLAVKKVPSIKNVIQKIPVPEFKPDKVKEILKAGFIQALEGKFAVVIDEGAIDAALRSSNYLYPDIANLDATYRVLESMAIKSHREATGEISELTDVKVYSYLQAELGFPVNPYDHVALDEYIEGLRAELKRRVVNQEPAIDALCDLWRQTLAGDPRKPLSLLITGTTGVGKTLLLHTFSELAFGSQDRVLKVDGTSMADGGFSLGTYFGTPDGVNTKGATSGKIPEFLDDPSRGQRGGLFAIDESDKMHSDVWQRLMEFSDRGELPGGDGRIHRGNHHIIVYTTNKGAREIFPPESQSWSAAEIRARVAGVTEADIKNYFTRPDPANPEKVLPSEVMGRVTRAVVMNPVANAQASDIGAIEVGIFTDRELKERKTNIKVSSDLTAHLSVTGIDTLEGARPMRSQINKYLSNAMIQARRKWPLQPNDEISLALVPETPDVPAKISVLFKGQSLLVEAPQRPKQNPLLDPAVQKMLTELEGKLIERVDGQPEAVRALATGIKAKYANFGRRRGISILAVGPTGIGKTELARALAYALFDDPERIELLPIGEIRTNANFAAFFGGDGSKTISPFEKALIANPMGGVNVMDEYSNIGDGTVGSKDSMLKRFYTVVEESFWTSPQTGKTYDLNKYVFYWTGNDLEGKMQGLSSDEQRLAAWELLREREVLHRELVKTGVPEAFVGRQDAVVAFRPLTGSTPPAVAKKLLGEFKSGFEKQNSGAKLTWDTEFEKQMAASFFTHNLGARSIRSVIDNQIASLLTDTLLSFGYSEKALAGLELRLSMIDNAVKNAFVVGSTPVRKVNIAVDLIRDGKNVFSGQVDVSGVAAKQLTMTEAQAKIAAYYHIGRVATNDEALTHRKFKSMSVRAVSIGEQLQFGTSTYETVDGGDVSQSRSNVMALLVSYWGGRLAQEHAGYEPDSAWAKDLAAMRTVTTNYLVQFGLVDGLEATEINDRGNPVLNSQQKQLIQTEMQKMFNESKTIAKAKIEAAWPGIQRAVAAVLHTPEISWPALKEILGGGSPPHAGFRSCRQAVTTPTAPPKN